MNKLLFALLITFVSVLGSNAQTLHIVDYSHKIAIVNKISSTDKNPQLTVKKYIAHLNGTLKVTGYVRNGRAVLSSVQVEMNSKPEKISKAVINGSCIDGYEACTANCDFNDSSLEILICMGSCVINCN